MTSHTRILPLIAGLLACTTLNLASCGLNRQPPPRYNTVLGERHPPVLNPAGQGPSGLPIASAPPYPVPPGPPPYPAPDSDPLNNTVSVVPLPHTPQTMGGIPGPADPAARRAPQPMPPQDVSPPQEEEHGWLPGLFGGDGDEKNAWRQDAGLPRKIPSGNQQELAVEGRRAAPVEGVIASDMAAPPAMGFVEPRAPPPMPPQDMSPPQEEEHGWLSGLSGGDEKNAWRQDAGLPRKIPSGNQQKLVVEGRRAAPVEGVIASGMAAPPAMEFAEPRAPQPMPPQDVSPPQEEEHGWLPGLFGGDEKNAWRQDAGLPRKIPSGNQQKLVVEGRRAAPVEGVIASGMAAPPAMEFAEPRAPQPMPPQDVSPPQEEEHGWLSGLSGGDEKNAWRQDAGLPRKIPSGNQQKLVVEGRRAAPVEGVIASGMAAPPAMEFAEPVAEMSADMVAPPMLTDSQGYPVLAETPLAPEGSDARLEAARVKLWAMQAAQEATSSSRLTQESFDAAPSVVQTPASEWHPVEGPAGLPESTPATAYAPPPASPAYAPVQESGWQPAVPSTQPPVEYSHAPEPVAIVQDVLAAAIAPESGLPPIQLMPPHFAASAVGTNRAQYIVPSRYERRREVHALSPFRQQ